MPQRFDKAARDEWLALGNESKTAAPVFPEQQFAPPAGRPNVHPNDVHPAQGWGAVQPCRQCGHGMTTFEGQRGAVCPNCGNEEAVMTAKIAEASMPPEGPPAPQKDTALPYNPSAYEGEVEGMHPAAQYTYQRAVAQGAAPQAAMAAAQEKQGEMMKRTQEGQNTEGVQMPVIGSKMGANPDSDACNLCNGTGQDENSNDDCARCGGSGKEPDKEREKQPREGHVVVDRPGFITTATIQRVSHLV
jgi:rubrerythrin